MMGLFNFFRKRKKVEIYNDAISSTQSQIDNIVSNGFKQYIYLANADSCSVCKELDDKVFDASKYKTGINAPPMHKKCRCSISPYMDREAFDRDLKRRGL